MKKAPIIGSSLVALFASVGANALTWSGGDLSDASSTVTCTGQNCILTPTTPSAVIIDQINIENVSDPYNFIIRGESYFGAGDHTYVEYNPSYPYAVINLTGQNNISFINNGFIENTSITGYGVKLLAANLTGDVINNGEITAPSGGIHLHGSTVGGNVENHGEISISGAGGPSFLFQNSTIKGNAINTADLNATVLWNIINSRVEGDVINTGNVIADNTAGISLDEFSTINGNLENQGTLNLTDPAGDLYLHGNINGSFINSGTISMGDKIDLWEMTLGGDFINTTGADITGYFRIYRATFGGKFINDGTINLQTTDQIFFDNSTIGGFNNSGSIMVTGTDQAVHFLNSTINGDVLNSGTISVTGQNYLVHFQNSNLTGDFINSGILTGQDQTLFMQNSIVGGSVKNSGSITLTGTTSIDPDNQGLGFFKTAIGGDFENSGEISISGTYGMLIFKDGTIGGDFVNSGIITRDSGNDHADMTAAVHVINNDINGSFINTNEITSEGGSAVTLYDVKIGGDFRNSGTLDGYEYTFYTGMPFGENLTPPENVEPKASTIEGDFVNSGTIVSQNSKAFHFYGTLGGNFMNEAGGTITANIDTVQFINSTIGGDFNNAGTIIAENGADYRNYVIDIDHTNITGSFINTGIIEDDEFGNPISINDSTIGGDFINSGTLTFEDPHYGYSITDGGGIFNSTIGGSFINSGEMIFTGGYGTLHLNTVEVKHDFINSGTIEQTTANGTEYNSGLVLAYSNIEGDFKNSGDILSTSASAIILYDVNIEGNFENSGTLSGNKDTVFFGSRFQEEIDSQVPVLSDIGGSFINSGTITSNGAMAIGYNGKLGGSFINTGTIEADTDTIQFRNTRTNEEFTIGGDFINDGFITAQSSYVIELPQYLTIDGDFINNGTISSVNGEMGEFSIATINGKFENTGTISTNGPALSFQQTYIGEKFENSGTISSNTDYGIVFSQTTVNGDFINSGTISGSTGITTDTFTLNGSFINRGNILGDGTGDGSIFFETTQSIHGDFINEGIISDTGGTEMYLGNTNIDGNFINSGTIDTTLVYRGILNGNFINSGSIDNLFASPVLDFQNDTIINGNFENSGILRSEGDTAIGNAQINGSFINSGTIDVFEEAIYDVSVGGNFTNSGDITVTLGNAVSLTHLGGDFENTGTITSNEQAMAFNSTSILGGFKNTGRIYGVQRAIELNSASIGKDLINSGSIQSEGSAIYMRNALMAGDIRNSGRLEGGDTTGISPSPAAIQIMASEFNGTIYNDRGGVITGYTGIASSSEDFGGGGSLTAPTTLTIVNNGVIEGTTDYAIAFDITADYGGADPAQDNVLIYSGKGTLIGGVAQIYMNSGDNDELYLKDAWTNWLTTDGVEYVNVDDTILTVDFDASSSVIEETVIDEIVLEDVKLLIDMNGEKLTAGQEVVLLDNHDITASDLDAIQVYFDGLAGYTGELELRAGGIGEQLIYKVNNAGEAGLKTDQAATYNTTPHTQSAGAAMMSSLSMNRGAITVVSQHAKAKTKENIEFASLASDTSLFINKKLNPGGLWAQGFGESAEYDGKTNGTTLQSAGYDSSNYGAVVGYDQFIKPDLLIGAALSYTQGEVDGDYNQFETDITYYQLSVYGSYNFDNYFVDGQLGVGQSSYDQKRNSLGSTAMADFDGTSTSVGVGFGYVWVGQDMFTLTPYGRLNYINSEQDSYTETGGLINLEVDSLTVESLQASIGAEVGYLIPADQLKFHPRFTLEYAQELKDDQQFINTWYADTHLSAGSGSAPELGENIWRLGLGVSMIGDENAYLISLDYKYETRDRYQSHGVIVNGKLFF